MKKTLGVISLAVLLSVQILTPVTYAVWDDDFVSETYVEESASEEVVEATDDTDEVSDEVSEEDDASEEVTEEDSSDEESQDEDTLDWDEDSEDTEESDALEEVSDSEWEEVSAWSSEESISEESLVLSEEDEAFIAKLSKQWSVAKIAEELWINWYTDSSEIAVLAWIEWNYYGTKEQNNIIREYLISHALELLKKNVPSEDVVEETTVEEAVSSEVESEWLNEEEISWSKYYNGVVVNVLAPVKSFPEGTTLSITPIKKKNELNEIKEQLVDSQEQITEESTVVAFDISFLYSWEEVQPVSWQTVQVTFNYENHEWLTDANENEDKELKVYHLNDKDGSGNKVEDISEVKVEAVETVKNEEWELVVDAESFSIYTIVTQVAEEWPEAIGDQLANFVYDTISIARPDWYIWEWPEWITIMDRNLGALTNDINSIDSRWYYYQWWNNYWLLSPKNFISEDVNLSSYSYLNPYTWGFFNTKWNLSPSNRDLWWDSTDTLVARQWPCPVWWHVPKINEWKTLIDYWKIGEGVDIWEENQYWVIDFGNHFVEFLNRFKLLRAWKLTTTYGGYFDQYGWDYRSSEHDSSSNFKSFSLGNNGPTKVKAQNSSYSRDWLPIRCFKNVYAPEIYEVTFFYNWWQWSTATVSVTGDYLVQEPSEPSIQWVLFEWWYTWEVNLDGEVQLSNTSFDFSKPISSDINLYAKWNCWESCLKNVEFYSWWTLVDSLEVEFLWIISNPPVPISDGFDFEWWYYDEEFTQIFDFSTPITKDLVLYARWEDPKQEWFTWEDGCFKYKSLGIDENDVYSVELIWYGVDDSCTRSNLEILWEIQRQWRLYEVRRIGQGAFVWKWLNWILVLDEWIQEIWVNGFASNSIEKVIFPSSLSWIDNYAFSNNGNLTDIQFSEWLKTIGEGSFQNCWLTWLNFPSSLKYIWKDGSSNWAFENNTSLRKVVFKEWIELIWWLSFKNTAIEELILPDTTRIISQSSFNTCPNLSKVVLNEWLLKIWNNAFSYNSSLTWFSIPSTVTSIWSSVFSNTPIETLVFNAKNASYSNASFSTPWTLRTVIWNWSWVINNNTFNGFSTIVNLTIWEDVTGIWESAFYSTNITWLTIPWNVKTIWRSSFYNVPLETLILGEWIETIWYSAFQYNLLSELIIPDSVTSVGSDSFTRKYWSKSKCIIGDGLNNLGSCNRWDCEELVIWNWVTSLNPWNFCWASSYLKKIKIWDWVTTIQPWTFSSMKNIEEIEIWNSLTQIQQWVFWGTPSLTGLKLWNSITTIWAWEFSWAQFSKIDLPNSLTTLWNWVFCSDEVKTPWSIIWVVSWATSMQIASLESQDNTKCLVLKKDKYELTYNAWAHSWKVDGLLTTWVVVDYNWTVQLTWNGVKSATSDKWYTFLWWTDEEWKTTTINSVVVTGDTEVYPVFKQTISATFNWNWNTVDNQKQQVVRECDRYNNETKCTINNVPVIDQNIYTTTILWYSLNAATWSAIAQFGTVTLDAATIAWWTTDIEINKNEVLYAQTYSPAVTRTVTYKKWENDSFGIIDFTPFTDSCTIAAIYNGNNSVLQATWCQLIAPEVQSSNGYEWYWEWPMTKGDQYTVYSDRTISAYSTGEHYSISFYLDGWEWPTGVTQQDNYQEWDTVEIHEPIWTGYTFIGWTTWSNTVPVKNISIQPSDRWSKLFVAHWQQDEYRIIYSDTVQWTTNLVSTYSYENGATLVVPNKSPMGYHFKWWIGENGDTPETSVTIPAWVVWDKYFTAVWEAESYTVTGHLNWWNMGGETTYVFTYDIESGNIALGTPTRENSTFIGWTWSNGSSPDLNVVISQWSHWDKEYYAVYTCNEWYEANGNTCVLKPYSVTYVLDEWKHTTVNPQETVTRDETSYKINIKNPIKTGYNFLWWTTNIQNATCKEGTTERANCRAESANDLTIEFADWQAVTLRAKWVHVPIEVSKQDLIGTTPTGTATVTEYGYDSRIDLAAEAMTWYRTLWWSEGTDWVVKYNDNTKEYVRDLTIVYDNPTAVSWGTWRVSLYSVRELINYTIKYVLNEWVQTNPTTYNVTQANIVLTDAVKTWYVFKWWYDADENKITTITPEVVAELISPYKLTLTARWETSKNTPYKVYHERQWIDGEYYKTNIERTDVDELTWETDKSVTPARRTNYVWFIMPVDQKTDTIKADGSTEIIYQYEREKHTYKYNTVVWATTKWKRSLDADYTTNATTTQMFFDTPIILSWKADTWYSWSWWDITSWGETTRIVAPTYEFNMPLVNVEVTPVVYHIPYTLKFDVNGWTGDSWDLADVYPIYYDSWITYPVVTRMWYTFLGWYDDVTNTRYGSGTEDSNLNMPNSDLTLTAHWQANDFTLNVNHYKMNLSGEYSETPNKIVQIETKIDADLTGTVNTGILPENYTGFTLSGDAVETIHINPDGSSVINYYYSRDRHNVRINENEGVILSGTMSGEYYYETPVAVEALAKTGYTWSWWNVTSGGETVFTDLTGVEFVLSTWDVELTPFVIVNEYHLTVKDGSTIIFSWDVLYKTNISTYLGSLSKNGYTFNGWTNRPANDLMPANDLVIEAKWTKISPSGWGGGGGSSSSSDTNKDKTPVTTWAQEQEHGSAELTGEVKKVDEPKEEKEEVKSDVKPIENMQFEEIKDVTADQLNKVDRTKLTKEQNEILDAYQWAYEHNVTTMVTLRDANPEWVVTRGHLAKMVVNYATNVLGQKIPEKIPSECRWNDYRSDWESQEIKDYAVKACALWLMWLNMKKFQPKVWVSRAQFGTIMSRLLWWKKYAGWTPYYRNHLNALKKNGIMTQIGNPEGRTELRQWVWLMLMRAGLEK